jgi:hypothetical protein
MLLADFFKAVQLRGNGVNLDFCMGILPVLEDMMSPTTTTTSSTPSVVMGGFFSPVAASNNRTSGGPSEYVVESVLKSLIALCEGFGELIYSTRALGSNHGGVDLSREDRLKKCNACYTVLERLKLKIRPLRLQYRRSTNLVLLELLDKIEPLLDNVVPP